MNKIIVILLAMTMCAFAQQINYTWGYNTSGTAYTQTGYQDADSSTTINIVFDMQDYYPLDFTPLVSDSGVIIANSNRQHLGTLWLRVDAQNAADSSNYYVEAYPGNMIYHPNDNSRITTSNLNFSTTATTLVDTSDQKGDIQWQFVNVYVNSSQDDNSTTTKHLPPEFVKVKIGFGINAADSIDVYWNFAYPALYESEQSRRSTTRGDADAKKATESLH